MNNSEDSYHDDPSGEKIIRTRKNPSPIFAIIALVIGGGFFLQTTLAANISLSSNSSVEFGQGTLKTTSCSGNTQLTLTPNSAFTNVAGAGSYKFSSVTVSGIPDSCWGKDFTINAYDESSNTPLALFNTTSTSAVIHNNTGTFALGAGSTGMSVTSGSGTFTATFTAPVALSSSVFRITIQSGEHTLFYNVGDRGPGGGIVFYISAAPFTSAGSNCNTTCKYLEVAPATWQGTGIADDTTYQWVVNNSTPTAQDVTTASTEGIAAQSSSEKYNWRIGQGFYNTSVMKVSGATSEAQAKVLAYAGGSTAGEWFIPSMNELNELCKYARGQATGDPTVACVAGSGTFKSTANAGTDRGGFVQEFYWSSTEPTRTLTMFQAFSQGGQSVDYSNSRRYVRPIRAF